MLLQIGDSPDLSHLEALLAETQKKVRELFIALIGPVAGAKMNPGELSDGGPPA
jgi:glutamate-ammonia-ligase adenylyltransferase